MSQDTTQRTEYIAGLRALADLLEQHATIPLPAQGVLVPMGIHYFTEDAREGMAQFARVFPGSLDKKTREGGGADYFDLVGTLHGVKVQATAFRDQVCTRVVKDVREVTEEVPDPDALAAVPTVTVTKTVEDVEWVCEPLLAPRELAARS
jgi:hypothetical protein